MKNAQAACLPDHPVFVREEFYGFIFYSSLDKSYYFFDKDAERVIEQILSGAALDPEGVEFKQELFDNGLLSSKMTRICHRQVDRLSAPLRVFIDITRACNLRCAHCFTDSGAIDGKNSGELTKQEIENLLDQMKEAGTFLLSIAGGEPLLRKDIASIITYAKKCHIDVSLTTNGTKITPLIAQSLNDLHLRTITVSIDGIENTHDQMRGAGNFHRAIEGVRLLKRYCQTALISIKTTVNSENMSEAAALIRLAEELQVNSIKFNPVRPFGRACDHPELFINRDQYVDFLKNVQNVKSSVEVGLPKTPMDQREYEFIPLGFGCTGGKETCNITASGDFSACAFLGPQYVVGNIRSQSFLKLWELTNQSVRYVGNATCQSCEQYNQCRGGCRNRAIYEYGNRDAIDPLCVLKKAIPSQKLIIRHTKEKKIIFDQEKGQSVEAVDQRLIDNKQYREIHNSIEMPFKVFFDPTYRCNSHCIHCYNAKSNTSKEEISLSMIASLAHQMADLGIPQISLAGGEPFVRSDIFEMFSVFYRSGIYLTITTNGILLTTKCMDLIANSHLRGITISIDGVTKDRYRQIRGVDALALVEQNLSMLRSLHIPLSMRYSVMHGAEEPSAVLQYAVDHGFDCLKVNKTHLLGRFVENAHLLMGDNEYDEWIDKMRLIASQYNIVVELPREKYLNNSPLACSAGKKTIYVSPQGDVHPCPFTDRFIFGNLAKASLKELIEKGERFCVDNPHCLRCPAMNKAHGITKKSYGV